MGLFFSVICLLTGLIRLFIYLVLRIWLWIIEQKRILIDIVNSLILIYTLNNVGSLKKKHSVQSPCNHRRTFRGFSCGCMLIVLKGSF